MVSLLSRINSGKKLRRKIGFFHLRTLPCRKKYLFSPPWRFGTRWTQICPCFGIYGHPPLKESAREVGYIRTFENGTVHMGGTVPLPPRERRILTYGRDRPSTPPPRERRILTYGRVHWMLSTFWKSMMCFWNFLVSDRRSCSLSQIHRTQKKRFGARSLQICHCFCNRSRGVMETSCSP